ncbi:MAG: hypothetical protein GWM90_33920, partial [Gemmatimonadetes bacterium]|nr:exo-alpha-sialidase [Gemmatimonadota bacterium]NIQ60334.1 exo-alpha-sialidase [Gemmatimonadota bacterium]NIU80555.1 hypothetical protein [Gammaproteobacteria bacterium]NIX48872.1 hypothetical protein [Gemmatimonadota bacterium]NIY13315.1 hypothetical protein [Gemmatimonadota bacterium]
MPAFLAACAGERAGAPGSAEGPAAVRAEAPVLVSAARAGTVHVEPVIAASPRDPSRLVAAAMVVDRPRSDRWHDSQHVVVYASRDAGRSWQPRPLPGLPDGWMSGDPWLTWTGGDAVYLSCVVSESVLDGRPVAVWVFRSGDGGWTWSGPTPAFPAGTEHDHPVIASGPGPQGEPRVAVFATRAGREGEGVDVAILPPEAGEAAALPPFLTETRTANLGSGAVLPDGAGLVFTWFRMPDPPRGLWAVAGDGRGSWTPVRLREGILPVGFPALTVDASEGEYRGRVYAAWVEGADPVDQRELRVLVSGSDDGGRSWSPPVRVHRHDVATQRTLPTVAVNRHGEVAAAWL